MVQTYEYKTKSTIMMREMGVQMDVGLGVYCEKTGLYMDTRKDKIIKPNIYENKIGLFSCSI